MALTRFTLVSVLVVVLLAQSNAKLIFESPLELQGLAVNAYQFLYVGDSTKLNVSSARIVASDPLHACHWKDIKNKEDFENNLVIVGKDSAPGKACSPATKFRNVEKGKALGVILLEKKEEYAGLSGSYYLDAKGISIGGVEAQSTLSDKEGYDLILKYTQDKNQIVIGSVQADDTELYLSYYIAFSVLVGLFALVNIYFALLKMRAFYVENGELRASLPQVCLALEVAANVLRIILCLEPDVDIGRGMIDFGTINFLQSGSLPWSFTSTLMIAFYWDQSLRAFGEKHTVSYNVFSLERWKIPLVCVCALMIIGDLVRCTILALYMGNREIAIVIFVFFGICAVGIGAYFTYSGIKVLEWAKQAKSSSKTSTLARMTQFVVANAVGLFWIVACLVVMSASTAGWFYGYIPLFFGLNFVSLVQINMFQPSAHFGSSTSGGKTTSGGLSSKTLNLQDQWTTTSSSKFPENTTEDTTTTTADGTSPGSAVEMV